MKTRSSVFCISKTWVKLLPALTGEEAQVFTRLTAHKEEAGRQKTSHPVGYYWLQLVRIYKEEMSSAQNYLVSEIHQV